MSEDNLFYSASDADSEGEEGTYFIYSYEEVYKVLEDNAYQDIDKMCQTMSVTEHGNFEGKNIIRFEDGVVPEWFGAVKVLLQKLRQNRSYPFIDKKVQTSWSSMMIHSLFKLGAVDNMYYEKAIKSLDALMETMFLDGTLYHTTLIHKTPKIEAFLEDYAFISQALLSAYKYTQDEIYLIHAQRFVNKALEEFYTKGVWNFSSCEFTTIAEISDNTYPSSVSIIIDTLLALGTLLEDEKYTHFAFKTMEYNSYELGRKPIYSPYMLTQVFRYLKGDRIVKSSINNIKNSSQKLTNIDYPFTLYKATEDNGYLICGDKSCFANTFEVNDINQLISNSFKVN